jgi:hypothetical protein
VKMARCHLHLKEPTQARELAQKALDLNDKCVIHRACHPSSPPSPF